MSRQPQVVDVSVIVPVHNGGASFRRCLESLAAANPRPSEVIVVADDDDASAQFAEEWGAGVLRLAGPHGPARARNLGAQAAKADVLFFVDADVAIHPDAVGQVAASLSTDPDLAAVFGTYDESPAATDLLSQYKNLLHHYTHMAASEDAFTFWGACGAIRRRVFLDLGGFDEGYRRPSIEDIELGYRLKQRGYRIRLCKTLQVKHLKRWGAIPLLRSDFFCRAIPWTDLILHEGRVVNDLNLGVSSRISIVFAYLLVAALAAALRRPGFIGLAVVLGAMLVMLNAGLYSFFIHRRGLVFTLQAIPWHWFYFLYGGLAFAIGIVRFMFSRPPAKLQAGGSDHQGGRRTNAGQ
jgi:GT2 family glycosyltransferase